MKKKSVVETTTTKKQNKTKLERDQEYWLFLLWTTWRERERERERARNEVIRNLYEKWDGRGRVEVVERFNKMKRLNLRRYKGENLKSIKGIKLRIKEDNDLRRWMIELKSQELKTMKGWIK